MRSLAVALVFLLSGVLLVACGGAGGGGAPQSEVDTKEVLGESTLGGYGDLPFTDILPMDEGEVEAGGGGEDVIIGFSQTADV